MISAPSPSTSDQMQTRREDLLAILSSTIGVPFELWTEQTFGSLTCTTTLRRDRRLHGTDVASAIDDARKRGFGTLELGDGTQAVWVRIFESARRQWLAFGNMPIGDSRLIHRLIEAAVKLVQQEVAMLDHGADMTSCLETLTYGMEEQHWLRSLTEHLTLCSARRSIIDVASELLPSLKQLVKAESTAILLTSSSLAANAEDGQKLSETKYTRVLWDGPAVIDESTLQSWLNEEYETSHDGPLIQNRDRVDEQLLRHDVQSVCAVQIRRGEAFFGWILAVNRSLHEQNPASEAPIGLSEMEFGSVEAGLIEAAATMLATHGHNFELLKDRESLVIGVIRAMGHAVDARDPYTRGHSERVGRYGRQLAEAFGLPKAECDRIYLSGLLHDVGKIGVPDAVLGKPGCLTDEEFEIIKRHPEIGARIVSTMPQLADLLPGILHHHESIDGTGYPYGLKGDEIPLMGRILAIADAYDAMTSDRPYRKGMPREKAVEIMTGRAGVQWDDDLLRAFISIPEHVLILEAVEGDQGWYTDERWLRGGAKSIFAEEALTESA